MSEPRLVGDIGGTYARFALGLAGQRPGVPRRFACADYEGPEEAIRAFLADMDGSPAAAAIAVAAPVTGDAITMTNHPWRFSVERLRAGLGLARLEVVNDFTAIALALPRLGPDDLDKLGGGEPAAGAAMAVLGPGTGLGVSGLIPGGGGWAAISGEGGHVDAAPWPGREAAVVERLRRRFGHVSRERLLSGPGLVSIYLSLAEIEGRPPTATPLPADVAAWAQEGDALAGEAAGMFSAMLGAAAGDLALTLGARGGVFIAGGVVPGLGAAFDRDAFRRRFAAKGRFAAYLEAIPSYLVTGPNPALIGLAALLDQDRGGGPTGGP